MEKAKIVLENQDLLLGIHANGGELARIYDKHKKREVLWEGTPGIWNRHALILFPFIGKVFGGKYRFRG